jgi:hypothetical protein
MVPLRTGWAGVVILVLLLAGSSLPEPPAPLAEPVPPVPLGAFLGSDGHGVEAIEPFTAWLGVRVSVGRSYLPGASWEDVEGPGWALDSWSAWRAARRDRIFVLNVPLVAPNEPPLDDASVASLLRDGAAGRYDDHFRRLAERLMERGAADTVIVLAWEMNGSTYSSRCAPDPEAWKQYWRQVVHTMRSVAGQRFRFDFAPVRGPQEIPWPQCYPGDDVVDIVGMDSYDQHPGSSFDEFLEQPYGLRHHAAFAAAHGKPMSYPEWGLYDFGDNPEYVRRMHAWLAEQPVVYHSIADYCPHGLWGCAANPASSRSYRDLFGARVNRRPAGR